MHQIATLLMIRDFHGFQGSCDLAHEYSRLFIGCAVYVEGTAPHGNLLRNVLANFVHPGDFFVSCLFLCQPSRFENVANWHCYSLSGYCLAIRRVVNLFIMSLHCLVDKLLMRVVWSLVCLSPWLNCLLISATSRLYYNCQLNFLREEEWTYVLFAKWLAVG